MINYGQKYQVWTSLSSTNSFDQHCKNVLELAIYGTLPSIDKYVLNMINVTYKIWPMMINFRERRSRISSMAKFGHVLSILANF